MTSRKFGKLGHRATLSITRSGAGGEKPVDGTGSSAKLVDELTAAPEILAAENEISPFSLQEITEDLPAAALDDWDFPTEFGVNFVCDPASQFISRHWRKNVFSPQLAKDRLTGLNLPIIRDGDSSSSEDTASKNARQVHWWREMACDFWIGNRELLQGSKVQVGKINAIGEIAPNFLPLTKIVIQALGASLVTDKPMRLPPILLVGPPGIGKTHVSRLIATALDTSFHYVAMPNLTGVNPMGGTSLVWRNPQIGIVAKALIESKTASPILLLDEIDKPFRHQTDGNPLDCLHGLLEASTARQFRDEFLELDVAADAVTWIASANSTTGIPPSILDRMLVLSIGPPTPGQMKAVLTGVYADLAAVYEGWFDQSLDVSVMDRLSTSHPRAVRRLLDLAMSRAASEARHSLTPADIDAALELTFATEPVRRFGFLG